MPKREEFFAQPPLELIRQWMDYGAWYDREKLTLNKIQDLQFLCAMGKPGGGRAETTQRLLSKCHMLNFTVPADSQIKRIFESIATYKFQQFEEEIKLLAEPLAVATNNLFQIVTENFLPTPAKPHYIFNMRDMSKVFQGLYRSTKDFFESREHIVKLWTHEILRIFHDRLTTETDREKLKGYLNEQLETHF